MNASSSLPTYEWISKRRFMLSCAISPVFLAFGCVFLSQDKSSGWRLAGSISVLVGLLMLVQKRTVFDKSQGLLQVAHRFLGLFPIWWRRFRFDCFDAVVIERRTSYHPSSPRAESESYGIYYRVGLRRKAGRPFWLREDSFSSRESCRRAEEFAFRVSCDTGFEIVEVEV